MPKIKTPSVASSTRQSELLSTMEMQARVKKKTEAFSNLTGASQIVLGRVNEVVRSHPNKYKRLASQNLISLKSKLDE